MENNDLFQLMEKYCLTLRRLAPVVTSCYNPIDRRPLKENEEYVELVGRKIGEEAFKNEQGKGYWKNARWNNGYVILKVVRETKTYDDGWLVKEEKGHGTIQNWGLKDFVWFGKTPSEAITKAIKDIELRKNGEKIKRQEAGLE